MAYLLDPKQDINGAAPEADSICTDCKANEYWLSDYCGSSPSALCRVG